MRMMALGLFALGATAPLQGQSVGVDSAPRAAWKHAAVHYGKWAAAAGAVTLTALALQQHRHSDEAWNQLLAICNGSAGLNCSVGADGRYKYYQAEYYYQLALYYDHRARWRLVAGQVSLLTAVGLFVADLRGSSPDPKNMPVHGAKLALTPTADGAALSLRIPF